MVNLSDAVAKAEPIVKFTPLAVAVAVTPDVIKELNFIPVGKVVETTVPEDIGPKTFTANVDGSPQATTDDGISPGLMITF